jgi:ribosomal protein S18 acetylase RimI-like enzyme
VNVNLRIRPFRNTDPPALVRLWNVALTGRGAAILPNVNCLELAVLARPYFESKGLLLAECDGQIVGFVHAGFGPDSTGQRISYERGVICVLAVHPEWRRQGVGTQLLRQAETYLRQHEAREIYFGCHRPLCPFYWGLYGGSEPSGVLESDALAKPFLQRHGYAVQATHIVYQRILDGTSWRMSPQAAVWKAKCELEVIPRPVHTNWFEACVTSPLEMFRLQALLEGRTVAQVDMWEMELFGWRWKQPSVGLLDLQVAAEFKGQGLESFLLASSLQWLEEQYYTLVEMHVPESDQELRKNLRDLGFEMVDRGLVYRLDRPGAS